MPEPAGISLSLAAPGETLVASVAQIVVASLNLSGKWRETMSDANRDERDRLDNAAYRWLLEEWGIIPKAPAPVSKPSGASGG